MLTFGCRAHDIAGADVAAGAAGLTPWELGAALAAQGVSCTQLALGRTFPQWSGTERLNPGLGSQVRRALAAHGVEVAVMGCYFNIIGADPAAREAGIEKFEAYLENARYFGSSIVATETGSVDPSFSYTEDNFTDEAFEEAASVIERLVRAGERAGTVVGIEPGVNHPIHDVATCKRLVERIDSPYLGFILDPTALITADLAALQMDIAHDMLSCLGSRVIAAHVVDYRVESGRIERCDLGEGQLDVGSFLGQVEAVRPGGFAITEFTSGDAIGRFVRSRSRSTLKPARVV